MKTYRKKRVNGECQAASYIDDIPFKIMLVHRLEVHERAKQIISCKAKPLFVFSNKCTFARIIIRGCFVKISQSRSSVGVLFQAGLWMVDKLRRIHDKSYRNRWWQRALSNGGF